MDKYLILFINSLVLLWFITVLVEAGSGIEKREVHRIVIKGGSRRPSRSHRGHHHHHYRDHGHKHHHHGSYESHERDRTRDKPYHSNRHHNNHHSGERDHSFEESPKHYNSHEISYEASPRYKPHLHRKPTESYQSVEYAEEAKPETYKESSGWSPLISSESSPQQFGSFENNYHAKRNAHKDHGANKNKKRIPPLSHLNIELTTSYPQKVPTYHSFLDTTDFPTLFSFDNDNLEAKPSGSSTNLGDFYPSAPGKNKKKKNNSYEVHENHKEEIFPKEQTSFHGLVPDLSETNSPLFAQSSKIQPVVVPSPTVPKNKTVVANNINNNNNNSKNVKNMNGGSRSRRVKTRS